MIDSIKTDDFVVALTAIGSITLGIFVKSATRRDHQKFFSRGDFAVGLDLIVASVIVLVTRASGRDQTVSAISLAFCFFALWATSTWVRRQGWDGNDQLKFVNGIIVPNLVGAATLITTTFTL